MLELNTNHLYNIFEEKLDENKLSYNPNFIFDFIKENLNKSLNRYNISSHKIITYEIIKNNLNLPWKLDKISTNPNITIDFIKENLDKNGVSMIYQNIII